MLSRKSAKKIYVACQLLQEAQKGMGPNNGWREMIKHHREGLLFLLIKDWSTLFGPAEIKEMTDYLDRMAAWREHIKA